MPRANDDNISVVVMAQVAVRRILKMPAPIPMVPGDRYGRLTVVHEKPKSETCGRMVLCRCDCGAEITIPFKSIRTGNTSSCGCLRREMVGAKNSKHGARKRDGSGPPEYTIWKQMRARCNNPNAEKYPLYGGRGIAVDPRWDDFEVFLADVGRRPSPRHSIDRIDNDGNYEPGNVRWATPKEQARNKTNNVRVLFDGKMVTITELAEIHAICPLLLSQRIRRGWTLERALNEIPVLGKNQYGSP